MTPPILLLIFNRPDLANQSFAKIRDARPRQLFIAADGPRPDREGEAELCEEARQIVDRVDWPCEIKTLFRSSNLGCRKAVGEGITWFFEHVEEGIILEDDCVADDSFFPYCAELLEHFRHDERVMCITGNNFQAGQRRGEASYYFSIYNHCWGWASWRRAWQMYDAQLTQWPRLRESEFLSGFLRPHVAEYWKNAFNSVENNVINTWDYAWTFSCWANSGLTVIPNVNLVSNIGFDSRATHTVGDKSKLSRLETHAFQSPFAHLNTVCRNINADHFTEDTLFIARETTVAATNDLVDGARRLRRKLLGKLHFS